jgi:Flp pilus assembly protein CpaB
MSFRKLPLSSAVLFGLAVAAGVLSLGLMQGYARRLDAERPDLGPPIPVVIAVHDLSRGTSLSPDMVRASTLPSTAAPPGALGSPDAVAGRELVADVTAGEALTAARLAGTSAGPVAALVPPGMQAFIVPSGLPQGAVAPGDRIDLLGTFGGGRPHVETVAEGIEVARVMAKGTSSVTDAPTDTGGPSLVLLVDADVGSQLAYAASFATLTVTIEAAADDPGGEATAPQPAVPTMPSLPP